MSASAILPPPVATGSDDAGDAAAARALELTPRRALPAPLRSLGRGLAMLLVPAAIFPVLIVAPGLMRAPARLYRQTRAEAQRVARALAPARPRHEARILGPVGVSHQHLSHLARVWSGIPWEWQRTQRQAAGASLRGVPGPSVLGAFAQPFGGSPFAPAARVAPLPVRRAESVARSPVRVPRGRSTSARVTRSARHRHIAASARARQARRRARAATGRRSARR